MKKVLVMLSSYFGERYIQDQIDSILCQQNVEVSLIVRDDGSKDGTCEIVQKNAVNDPRIRLIRGDNIGFRRSFFELLLNAPLNYDYYAFSDQDDIWESDKLSRAVDFLETTKADVKLYASGLKVVDEKLNFKYLNSFSKLRITYGSALSRQRLAGCTMVFNTGLLNCCRRFRITESMGNLFSHDAAVYYICLSCGGQVVFDPESRILFRRHIGTVTEHGKGFLKRVESVTNVFNKFRDRRFRQAAILYDVYEDCMPPDVKAVTKAIIHYRDSFKNTIALMLDTRIMCGIWSVDIINKLAIFLHCY